MNPGLIPPPDVAEAARRGLELREKFGRGGTSVGINRGRQLAERRPVSIRDIVKMSAYFARHEVDKDARSHVWGDDRTPPPATSPGCSGAASLGACGPTA